MTTDTEYRVRGMGALVASRRLAVDVPADAGWPEVRSPLMMELARERTSERTRRDARPLMDALRAVGA